jgi:hypothetical protein
MAFCRLGGFVVSEQQNFSWLDSDPKDPKDAGMTTFLILLVVA